MQSLGKQAWNLLVILTLFDVAYLAGAALVLPLLGLVGISAAVNLPVLLSPVE